MGSIHGETASSREGCLRFQKSGPDSAADDAGGFPAEIGAVSVPMANGS
jgi:hypothetical protein